MIDGLRNLHREITNEITIDLGMPPTSTADLPTHVGHDHTLHSIWIVNGVSSGFRITQNPFCNKLDTWGYGWKMDLEFPHVCDYPRIKAAWKAILPPALQPPEQKKCQLCDLEPRAWRSTQCGRCDYVESCMEFVPGDFDGDASGDSIVMDAIKRMSILWKSMEIRSDDIPDDVVEAAVKEWRAAPESTPIREVMAKVLATSMPVHKDMVKEVRVP